MSKLNILVAYPYMKPPVIAELQKNKEDIRFVLDSGAFTAWKAGKPIQLDDYCRFIESLPFAPWRYFTLDVIGDPHGTMKNYETMLSRGFKPVPIFTRGEDPSVLEDYYKTSDVVGIGGLVKTPKNTGFVKGIMKYIRSRKVHWLGFTDIDFIKFYKPYMCDSSGWDQSRYGAAKLYLGNGEFVYVRKESIKRHAKGLSLKFKEHGIDVMELLKDSSWSNNLLKIKLGIAAFINYSQDLEKQTGTKIFAAVGSSDVLQKMVEYKKFHFGVVT